MKERTLKGNQSTGAHGHLCKLGVLCVHGIGTQKQGETLDAWGGRIIEWLQEWLRPHKGQVVIQRSALRAGQLVDQVPAHTRFQIKQNSKPRSEPCEWMIAESWWAEDFYPPPFRKLAGWLLTRGSWVIVSHVADLCFARGAKLHRFLLRKMEKDSVSVWIRLPVVIVELLLTLVFMFVGVLGAFLIVFLVQFLVVMLTVASAIPIPSLRSYIKSILVTLQGVLGDSFVFSTNPLVRTSVLNRVQDDLLWLEERCDSVVVLAHSQGAAIAFQALADYQSRKLRRLITFGSGLLKLSELHAISELSSLVNLMGYAVLAIPLYIVAAPAMWHAFRQEITHLAWVPWHMHVPDLAYLSPLFLLPPVLAFITFLGSKYRHDKYRDVLREQLTKLPFEDFRWIDIFSTHDPVPSGPMFEQSKLEGFETHCVVNRMSMLNDHITYWENFDEFVSIVVRELDGVAGTGLFGMSNDLRVERAIKERKRRVRWLRWCRAMLFLSVLVPVLLRWGRVLEFGKTHVANYLPQFLFEKWAWLKTTMGLKDLATHAWSGPGLVVQDFAYAMLGVSVIAGLAWTWYYLIFSIWRSWNRSATAESMRLDPQASLYFWSRAAILLLAGAAVYVVLRCMWFGGYHQAWLDLTNAPSRILSIIGTSLRWGRYIGFVVALVFFVIILVITTIGIIQGAYKRKPNSKEKRQ